MAPFTPSNSPFGNLAFWILQPGGYVSPRIGCFPIPSPYNLFLNQTCFLTCRLTGASLLLRFICTQYKENLFLLYLAALLVFLVQIEAFWCFVVLPFACCVLCFPLFGLASPMEFRGLHTQTFCFYALA